MLNKLNNFNHASILFTLHTEWVFVELEVHRHIEN